MLIAISTDAPENLLEASIKSKSNFPILQDPDGSLLTALDLLHKGGHPIDGSDIARPAVVLFGKNGEVIWSKATENYRVRPTPAEILKEIQVPR